MLPKWQTGLIACEELGFSQLIRVVAQPWRRAGKLGILSGLCVAPLRLGGLRGKQSTPSVWLGGTGESLRSASWSWKERKRDKPFGFSAIGYGTQVYHFSLI
jgi:hypothetical protein